MPLGLDDTDALHDIRAVLADLTPRERDVLRQLLDGQRKSEIGRALGISPRTVESHRANLLAKIGVANTPRMIARILACQYASAHAGLSGAARQPARGGR